MEAIVALVLIATTGMSLFSWINSNIITLNRVQNVNAENAATANALEYLQTINPMAMPEGRADLGSLLLSWKAESNAGPRDGASYPLGVGAFQLAYYQTQVTVQRPDGQAWFTFPVQQVGYRRVSKTVVLPF